MKTKTKKKREMTLDDLALMMGRGFNEAREKMDKGFAEVDKKFAVINEEIGELRGDVGELKNNFNSLQIAVDGYAKKADSYFQEMVLLSHKVDRMERWVLQLAEKVGVQLKA